MILPPSIGKDWGLSPSIYQPGSVELGDRVEARWHRHVGHPLPATTAFDASGFLPYAVDLDASLGDELLVSWSFAPGFDPSGLDRITVTLNDLIDVWLPPDATELRLPADLLLLPSLDRVDLFLEDQNAIVGYPDVLENFAWTAPLWSDSTVDPERRVSHALWLAD